MLDENHDDIHVNEYNYHERRIGQHYVVMIVQLKMGTNAASNLVVRMHTIFKNIRYFLMIEIGDEVLNYDSFDALSQIVFGNVVVSHSKDKYDGVFRYDFGASIDESRLELNDHTNDSSSPLLSAINSFVVRHSSSLGIKISKILQEMRRKIHLLEQVQFEDSGVEEDKFFHDHYHHSQKFRNQDCKGNCDPGESRARQNRGVRAIRQIDTPYIHLGTIGSSNQLQISTALRTQIQREHGVICFEMKDADVIHEHPALVIREICDYSDSHRNKKWQKYAIATTAAYAKELLLMISAQESTIDI